MRWLFNTQIQKQLKSGALSCRLMHSCSAMDRHMQHAVFHNIAFLAFSCLAFSTPAKWCRIFMSRNFMSRIFSVPVEKWLSVTKDEDRYFHESFFMEAFYGLCYISTTLTINIKLPAADNIIAIFDFNIRPYSKYRQWSNVTTQRVFVAPPHVIFWALVLFCLRCAVFTFTVSRKMKFWSYRQVSV